MDTVGFEQDMILSQFLAAGQDFLPFDETYSLSNTSDLLVPVYIIDDNFLESVEIVRIVFESNSTLSNNEYFLVIDDNDRKSDLE